MRKFIAVSVFAVACGQGQSKLDDATKVCKPEDNKARKLVLSEDKAASCEEYYCDVGATHYYAVKCEMTDRRRVWTSVDTMNGPQVRWLNDPNQGQAPQAEPPKGPPQPDKKK